MITQGTEEEKMRQRWRRVKLDGRLGGHKWEEGQKDCKREGVRITASSICHTFVTGWIEGVCDC